MKLFNAYANKLSLSQANQPKSPQLKYVTKHLAYVFYKNHISFFLSGFKKTNTLHLYRMCGERKTLKQGWAIIVAPGPLTTLAHAESPKTRVQLSFYSIRVQRSSHV